MPKINSCLCIIFFLLYKVTNLTLYMYLFINVCYTCIPFIYVDVHLKTILAATLACVSEDEVCCKDCLPVKLKDPKFMKLMKDSNFSNYFIICLPSFSPLLKL